MSCDSLVSQGLRCEWGAGVLHLVLSLSLFQTGHWKFNMAPHGKELSQDLKKRIVALHKDGIGYKKIAKTLKLSCTTVVKTIQWFNRTGSVMSSWRSGRGLQWQPVKLWWTPLSVVTWKDIIKYLQKCEGCTHFCEIYIYIYIFGVGPLSALSCCVNARLLSAIKKISPLIYSQSWDGSWVYTTQAMMTFTLIF